jgi:N-acetylated-alpha-linked acidic dipeptidase
MGTTLDRDAAEARVVESVRLDDAWSLVEQLSTLTRESGSRDERTAAQLILRRLEGAGIPATLHEPELLISLPRPSALIAEGVTYHAKTPSMAGSTPENGVTAPVLYQEAGFPDSIDEIFVDLGDGGREGDEDVAGRIVLTEGFPMPERVAELAAAGAIGLVCVSPSELIHEDICTGVWGSPDLTSHARKPTLPVVSVGRSDGEALRARVLEGELEVTIVARHDEGYRPIPVIVAEIRGTEEPERFVLVHGHLDSWHAGVGDNATGDATLLELARALHANRDDLRRSVRIAWWSGHSTGRYAGSAWYADAFALDLERNCVCHVNCDSPGCRDADVYENVYWMAETAEFASAAIRDFTGLPSAGAPPQRAGDISFNNLGISTFFMLTSTMTGELRRERGLHAVGGCGGNVEWHTEADTMEVADPDRLLRDMRLYTGAVFRAANREVHPLDHRMTVAQIAEQLFRLRFRLDGLVDLDPTFARIDAARAALDRLAGVAAVTGSVGAARPINDALLAISRALVSVLYSRDGTHRQDPALTIALLPEFADAAAAVGRVPDGVLRTELQRARNRLDHALELTCEHADAAVAAV